MPPPGAPILVKIGGSMMDQDQALRELCGALAALGKSGHALVLVHGGGKDINRHLAWLREEPRFRDGLRVTTPEGLKVVEMTLSGWVNKKLVGYLNVHGARAAGISGVDGSLLECEPLHPELGRVGRIRSVRRDLADALLREGFLPVVSPISVDAAQNHFNVNADEAAGALAQALRARKLIFVSDVEGVNDPGGRRIGRIAEGEIEDLIRDGVATGGMIPKLRSCRQALLQGVSEVHICAWKEPARFSAQLLGEENHGTVFHRG